MPTPTTQTPQELGLVPAEKIHELQRSTQTDNSGTIAPFSGTDAFEVAQRMAKALATSDMVPEIYRGANAIGNCLVALEIANRVRVPVLITMQHMVPIHGRPAWSAQFLIAAINASGRFSPLRYRFRDLGAKKIPYTYWTGERPNRQRQTGVQEIQDRGCVAYCTDRAGQVLESMEVTLGLAVAEGWYNRSDSKWKTMPDQMLMYRAASFFSRAYCPEITIGMPTQDDVRDAIDVEVLPLEPEKPALRSRIAETTVSAMGVAGSDAALSSESTPAEASHRTNAAPPESPRRPGRPRKFEPAPTTAPTAPPAVPAPVAPTPPSEPHPAAATGKTSDHAKLASALSEAGIEFPLLLAALKEYGACPDDARRNTLDDLKPDEVKWSIDNQVAVFAAIKSALTPEGGAE